MANLRSYQSSGVSEIRGAFMSGHRRVLYCLPTGGGKTVIFTHIATQSAIKGSRIGILVHRQELVDQTSRALHGLGCNHGVIAAGYRQDLRHTVQVASVQTLARRLHTIPPDFFQLLIIDEAHHAVAGTWAKVIAAMPSAYLLGVSATPERLDGRGLGEQFDNLIIGPSAAWLTEHGYLCPARIFTLPGVDLSSIRRGKLDTKAGKACADGILRAGQAMGDAVTHYRRSIADQHNGTAIAFCVSVAHAEAVADAFRQQGIPAAMLDGATDRGVRKRMIADLGAGVLKVLTSCEIISEGTDIPSVTGAILLRPTDSLGLYLQQVGRVLRTAPGKNRAIINDHVGNVCRHGPPTMPQDWTLEGRPTRKRDKQAELPVKVCPQCFCTVASTVADCPECGHHWEPPRRELVTVSGSLQELTAEQHALNLRRQVARARTREELECLRLEKGYSRGWTDHILRARAKHGR